MPFFCTRADDGRHKIYCSGEEWGKGGGSGGGGGVLNFSFGCLRGERGLPKLNKCEHKGGGVHYG